MDQSYISAFAALSGTIVGGLTSFMTSWMTQRAQTRAQRIDKEIARREEIYGRFIDEMARFYALAVTDNRLDPANAINLMASKGRLNLFASEPVLRAADSAAKYLFNVHRAANPTPEELSALVQNLDSDPVEAFARACRLELRVITRGRLDPDRQMAVSRRL